MQRLYMLSEARADHVARGGLYPNTLLGERRVARKDKERTYPLHTMIPRQSFEPLALLGEDPAHSPGAQFWKDKFEAARAVPALEDVHLPPPPVPAAAPRHHNHRTREGMRVAAPLLPELLQHAPPASKSLA